MKNISIDGLKITDQKSLDLEFKKKLTSNISWINYQKSDHLNLDALNDFLRGGFNVFDFDENISITWNNFIDSKNNLRYESIDGQNLIDCIVNIIKAHKHIILNLN